MRHLFAAAVLLSAPLAGCGKAPEPATAAAPAETFTAPSLGIGDPAPPFVVPVWVKGGPVAKFEPGTVYVVEFWATWCGPCISSMPHLNALAAEHKAAGLKVLAVTTKDEQGNTQEKVEAFVKGKGAGYDFTWAFFPTDATYRAYMEAAGQDGIPCSFVVDKAGKVAFIGHPAELDEVLPKVLAGTWRGKADLDELAKADDELATLLKKVQAAGEAAKGGGLEAALAAARTAAGGVYAELPKYEEKYPGRKGLAAYRMQKLAVAAQAGKLDDAKGLADGLLADAVKKDNRQVFDFLVAVFTSKELNPEKKHPGVATAAADAYLKSAGADDLGAVMAAARAYYAAGDKAKADAQADAARKLAAGNADLLKQVEEALKGFQG